MTHNKTPGSVRAGDDHPPARSAISAGVRRLGWAIMGLACFAAVMLPRCAGAQVAVTTHHYDVQRTGWNPHETKLTYAAMNNRAGGKAFGQLHSIALDAQVDAQPLVVPNALITGDPNAGSHDVVFVVTELNTVYAIDPIRGTVLNSRNLGTAVPSPLGCTNNAATVGINSTPVIDTATNSMYVMTYTNPAAPTFTLHRLALADFSDVVTPEVIAASHALSDGSTFAFNGTYQRERSALLMQNGSVYAAFGSFCDFSGDKSRGWLLGWHADTLAPLEINSQPGTVLSLLTNTRAQAPDNYFLSSIWMSGAGPAADPAGNIYFVTGNSDPHSFSVHTNVQESVVKFDPIKNQVTGLFTPYNVLSLDRTDADFGSGGIVALPNSASGLPPRLATAVGKDGWMFLMNRDALGGFSGPGGPDKVIGRVQVGGCWCQPSYFEQAGVPQIVSSGGTTMQVWTLSGSSTPLVAGASASIQNGQDGGFFTSISSNGDSNPIIWAVGRPLNASPGNIRLYAYSALPKPGTTSLVRLYTAIAGTWPISSANANIVPVVANGLVYVASSKQLTIWGLGGTTP